MKTGRIVTCLFVLCFALLGFNSNLNAQQAPAVYKLTGLVADSASGKGLPFVTLSLSAAGNKKQMALSSEDGKFSFARLKPASYELKLDATGHLSKSILINLTGRPDSLLALGIITLQIQPKDMKELVVTARRQLVKQEVDRISYDLQADPESLSGNVLEMMRKVPYLSLDAEGNVLLKGSPNYRIFINGKPSGMAEASPKDILRSMPAATIQRIEVITMPPSKYDAEGLAGIINIITNKRVGNGYNGSFNINERGPVGGPGTGSSVNIKEGKLGIAAFGGGNLYRMPQTDVDLTRAATAKNSLLLQNGQRQSDSRSGYFGTEWSYELDSLQLLSAQFNINGNRAKDESGQSTTLTESGNTLQQYRLQSHNKYNNGGLDLSLNYQLGFKADKRRLLTFSYRYFKYHNGLDGQLSITDRKNYPVPDYNQSNRSTSAERTFQIDYVRPVKKINIEAGVKAILRSNGSNFLYAPFNSSTGQYEQDPAGSNVFDNRQHIFGAYNTYQFSWNGLDIKAGVRIEKTFTDIDFVSAATKIKQDYFNIIPAVVLNKRLKKGNTLNLSFGQRIKRPGINRLNPFVDRSNPAVEITGNPNLKPVTLNNLQLAYGLNKKIAVNAGLTYSWVKNLDLRVSVLDPVTNINRISYQNSGKGYQISFNYNLNYPVTNSLTVMMNGNIAYFNLDGLVNNKVVPVKRANNTANLSGNYKLKKGWRLAAGVNYNGRRITDLQATTNGFVSSSFSFSKSLLKDKLALSAFTNNPFTPHRAEKRITDGTDFREVITVNEYFRDYGFSINYKFGKLKDNIRKNSRGIRNDDLSN